MNHAVIFNVKWFLHFCKLKTYIVSCILHPFSGAKMHFECSNYANSPDLRLSVLKIMEIYACQRLNIFTL